MNPYDTNKVLTFYSEAREALAGRICRPRTALIYPSRACNQHCYYCSDANTNRELRQQVMDPALLMSLPLSVSDLGCQAVELCGGGEPFTHPDIAAFIQGCAVRNLKLGSLTNGTLLKGELAEHVVDHFSFVRISIDSFNPTTYRKVRGTPETGPASLPQVIENIQNLVKLKKESGSKMLITIKAVFNQSTLSELSDYIEFGCDLGVDGINIKAVRNVPDQLELQRASDVLEEYKRLNSPGRPHVFGSLTRTRLETPHCFASMFHVFIDTTGEVRLCCYYQNRVDTHTFGNLHRASLRDIWYGDRHLDAVKGVCPDKCQLYDCKYFRYNKELTEGIADDHGQWQFT